MFSQWNGEVTRIAREVKEHARTIRAKKELISPTVSAAAKRSLEIQEEALRLQGLSLEEQRKVSDDKAQEKSSENAILPETEGNLVLGECSVLGDMLPVEDNWEDAEDEAVGSAMRSLDKWQDQMNTVERAHRKFENMATRHDFPEARKPFPSPDFSSAQKDIKSPHASCHSAQSEIVRAVDRRE